MSRVRTNAGTSTSIHPYPERRRSLLGVPARLSTFSSWWRRAKVPWLGLERKYVMRPTVPLFLPVGSSSCTPYLWWEGDGEYEKRQNTTSAFQTNTPQPGLELGEALEAHQAFALVAYHHAVAHL